MSNKDNHIPRFTDEATYLWGMMADERRKLLLANVFCAKCGGVTTMVEFSGEVHSSGALALQGLCCQCGDPVARVIETGELFRDRN
ncbi:MAG: hypothetical protein K9N62_10700 [Verrucomicrobia bacterium]|nr:hypothetical protein [Verrucomicrobiota bacterium]